MKLSARRLNRATLARQLLLSRQDLDVVEAVRALCALQAQSPASPYLALWNRVAGFDPADMDRAFAEHRVVKAMLMRATLHAVGGRGLPGLPAGDGGRPAPLVPGRSALHESPAFRSPMPTRSSPR